MLTKDEEDKVREMIIVTGNTAALRVQLALPAKELHWFVKRLQEINEECAKYAAELQKANEELARLHEVYGA